MRPAVAGSGKSTGTIQRRAVAGSGRQWLVNRGKRQGVPVPFCSASTTASFRPEHPVVLLYTELGQQ